MASATALLLGIGALALGTSSAMAAPGDQNSAVVVRDIVLADTAGNPLTGQLTVGDQFVIQGAWDATTADPQPGETFVIGLPVEFGFVLGGPPIHLNGEDEVTGETRTWATCAPDDATRDLTCTFTDAVIDRAGIHGTFQFDVNAALETTETTVEFDQNGLPGIVELPGGGGIDDGIDLPDEVAKSGVMNDNNWSMTWTIDIPGASLVAAGGDVAHIGDTLGAGHVLCDPIGLTVQTVRDNEKVDVSGLASLTSGAPGESSFAFDLNAPEAGFDSGVTYRVEYQTCTPDSQIPEVPTEFSNEAQIEGWGESGIGIGVATSTPWHQSVTKSGSVLGKGDRNGKISWTVTIPGDLIAGNDSFTLNETLGAGHELGADTISGIQVVEQYGPNPGSAPGLRQDITSNLIVTENSAPTASAFDLMFTIKNASGQTFKESDWRYIVTYDTYVTSEDLPEGGTQYTNAVEVDGNLATGTANVPDRRYVKTGWLNTTDKTLDGVEHSAFTTLTWDVTIPGEKIDGLSTISLTDTLSETHQVCAAGEPTAGVAERLGIRVKVLDQITDGGKTPSDNEQANVISAEVDGQQITLTVDPGPVGKFSRDYQYIISYTTCTSSGGVDAKATEYTNKILGSGIDRTGTAKMEYGGSGTGTGVARGSVAVSKLVTGPGAAFVPEGTTFDVKVEEFAPGATEAAINYILAVPVNGDPVQGLNQRGTGWTIKLSEPTFPNVPGVTFGVPQFAEGSGLVVSEGGAVATATITPATNIAVKLTNTAELGQMSVTKILEGPAAEQVDPSTEYSFTAAIDVAGLDGVPAQADRAFTLTAGETQVLGDLPIGAVVTVSEMRPSDDDMFTWSDPVISPVPVTITADNVNTAAAVTVTNSVSRTVGTFTLSKDVTGAQAENPAVPESVTVTATWQQEGETAPSTKEITLPTDGTQVDFGEQLLIGTEVTLTEAPLDDGSSIAWGAPGWSGTGVAQGDNNTAVVTVGRDAAAHVTLHNHAMTSTAGISLLKVLSGQAVSDVPDDAEFPVSVTWTDSDDELQSVDVLINAHTPTPLGVDLPAGTVVTVKEGDRPSISTVDWGTITISGNNVTDAGDGSAHVVVSDQQGTVTLISVTNEAEWADGTFALAKNVDGVLLDDAAVPGAVEVIATWYEAEGEGLVERSETIAVPTDGSTVDFGKNLPAFTEVTLSEILPVAADHFTWGVPGWVGDDFLTVNEDGSATLTVQPAGDHELRLTNTAEATLGNVQLMKQLSGSGAKAVSQDTEFTVTAEWTDLLGEQRSQEVRVSASAPTMIEGLPFGTEVTLTEAAAQNPSGARWATANWSSQDERVELSSDGRTAKVVITGENEAPIALVLENDYVEVGPLALTGGEISGILTAAIVLMGLGGAALVLRHHRKQS